MIFMLNKNFPNFSHPPQRRLMCLGVWCQRGSWESQAATPAAEIPDQLESCGEPRSSQTGGRQKGGQSQNWWRRGRKKNVGDLFFQVKQSRAALVTWGEGTSHHIQFTRFEWANLVLTKWFTKEQQFVDSCLTRPHVRTGFETLPSLGYFERHTWLKPMGQSRIKSTPLVIMFMLIIPDANSYFDLG